MLFSLTGKDQIEVGFSLNNRTKRAENMTDTPRT